jgi:hypothetical protein
MDSIRRWLIPTLIVGVLAFGASAAQAARVVYPSNENVRTLDSGPAGWEDSSDVAGPCVPVLLCPTVTNSIPSSGGANGGYLLTEVSNFAGVDATAKGQFVSPSFKYKGVGGERPDKLKLKLSRIADVEAFLEVEGDSATYSVQLLDSNGPNVQLLAPTSLGGAPEFTNIKPVDIEPGALRIGHTYRVRIVSTFNSGTAQVVPSANAGYDNIRLTAHRSDKAGSGNGGNGGNGNGGSNGGNGNNGANGGNGGNGNGGANGGNGGRFGGNGIIGRTAKLRGDRLIVRVGCKKKESGRCRVKLQARLRKHGPAVTAKRVTSVKPGKKRRVALNVRDRFAERVAKKKKVVLRQVVRKKNGKKVKGYKRVRVKLAG